MNLPRTPAPGPFHDRRHAKRHLPRRPRSTVPGRIPVILRGRAVSDRQRAMPRRAGFLPDVLLALLFFAISLAVNFESLPTTPTHPDETRWLNRAYFVRELGDPFGSTWQDYTTTRGQPPLGSIVMGIGLAVQGKPLDSVGVWDFAYGRDWNTRTSAQPSQDILYAGRQTNAVIGAMVAAGAFVLGRLLTNRVGGSIAALFVAFHPLHIMLSTQALSDQTLALLLMLIFIAGWAFAKRPTWSRAILLGILLGLGGSVKLTPLLLALPLAGFGVLRLLWDRDRAAWSYAVKLAAQPAIAFAAFVLSYPYLWPSPIRRSWGLYEFRLEEMELQGSAWPDAAVDGPLDALARFAHALSETHSPTRRLLQLLYTRLDIDRAPLGLDFIPAAAGVIVLLWWVLKRGFWSPAAMVALLMGAEATMLVVGMKTEFYRYHLPIVVIMTGCIGVSTGAAWHALTRRRGHDDPQPSPRPALLATRLRQPRARPAHRSLPTYHISGAQEAPR